MMCHSKQSKLSWDSKIEGKAKTRIDPRDRTLKLLVKFYVDTINIKINRNYLYLLAYRYQITQSI